MCGQLTLSLTSTVYRPTIKTINILHLLYFHISPFLLLIAYHHQPLYTSNNIVSIRHFPTYKSKHRSKALAKILIRMRGQIKITLEQLRIAAKVNQTNHNDMNVFNVVYYYFFI